MTRTTFAQLKASRVAKALGICSDSDKFRELANEAQDRLRTRGRYVGTYSKLKIATTANSGLITWPREVETVEGIAVCNVPMPIRNQWFEFLSTGPGIQDEESCGMQFQDVGNSALIADITGSKKIKIYIDNAADAGKEVWIKAKDANGFKIVQADGTEGFPITLVNPSTLNATIVTEVYGVIKDVTLGAITMYQVDTTTLAESLIGLYAPDETSPYYRRTFVSGLQNSVSRTVTAIATLAFRPLVNDTDFLLIGNIPAMKEMMTAINFQEQFRYTDSTAAEARAIRELELELDTWLGMSGQPSIQIKNTGRIGMPVQNVI